MTKPWYWSQEGEDRYYEAVRNAKLCDGAKETCDKPCTRRVYAMGRGNWFVCDKCREEVWTFINLRGYKLMFDLALDEKDPPDPDPNRPIVALSWSSLFRDHIRGKSLDEESWDDEFSIILEDVGTNRIAVLKEVRAITGLPYKDVLALVDKTPSLLIKNVSRYNAKHFQDLLEKAGAKISVR